MKCRGCASANIRTLIDVGAMPPVCFPKESDEASQPEPLVLVECAACRLVQLGHSVPRERLYADYWYRSGTNESMVAELAHVARSATARVEASLLPGRRAVDIGANDGTLLRHYDSRLWRVAVEPSPGFAESLQSVAHEVKTDFFPCDVGGRGEVAIVTSIAMFYDVDAPVEFAQHISEVLVNGGVWVVQFQDLFSMVAANAFDNICHEHLTYYSLTTLSKVVEQAGLEVVDVEWRAINGGSLRVYISHRGSHDVSGTVSAVRTLEQCLPSQMQAACDRMRRIANEIARAVDDAAGPVDLYGASTKSQTLLHVAGLDHTSIRHAIERSPSKVGRYVGATGIPIVSEEEGRRDPAQTWLLGIWQFRDAVVARERAYLDHGGTMLIPLPTIEVVHAAR